MSSLPTTSPPLPAPPLAPGAELLPLSPASPGVAVLTPAPEGRILQANSAFARLVGVPESQLLEQPVAEVLTPVFVGGSDWLAFRDALARGAAFRATLPLRAGDGPAPTASISYGPLRAAPGVRPCDILVLSDPAAESAEVTALRESEFQHRLLADSIRDLVTVHRPRTGVCLYASRSARAILGHAPEEVVSTSLYSLIHPEHLAHARKVFASHVTDGAESSFTLRLRRKDGSFLWVETRSTSRMDREGRIEIVSISRDISRRKETEATLSAMHGLLRAVYEAVPVGICLVDNRNVVQLCNRAYSRLFEYDPVELAGRPVATTLPVSEIALAAADPGAVHAFDAVRRHGGTFPAELSVTPVQFTDAAWRLITLADQTERRRIETRLREARQLESLGTLAGGIAHDFNNLLTIILGYAGLLRGGSAEDSPRERAIQAIIDAGKRGADVVRQLQLFASQHEIDPIETDLHALIEETIETTCADWPANVRVVCLFSASRTRIAVDPTQVTLGLRHLLQNACDAMPAGGIVNVRTRDCDGASGDTEPEPGLVVTVEDNGKGMDESTRSRMFEPFFAKDKGPSVRGLGLAVVYGIMRAHRGQIEVDSEPGLGTRVHLRFPRPSEPAGPELPLFPSEDAPPRPSSRHHVLVVEDEADIGRLWANILESEGIPMLWARDGEEALRLFAQHRERIGLLFSDIGLPGLDGWQVAQRIRAEVPTLPLLLVSGAFRPGDRAQFDLAPPVVCLPKPFPPSEVLARVRSLLPREA
jgi:two-component system, cell cycle sensor histidine kinase and response regulator CckA